MERDFAEGDYASRSPTNTGTLIGNTEPSPGREGGLFVFSVMEVREGLDGITEGR